MTIRLRLIAIAVCCGLIACGCSTDDYDIADQSSESLTRVHTERNFFKDERGRYLYINGVNAATKTPRTYDPISYTGIPFETDEVEQHVAAIRRAGFNAIRLMVSWEGIEPQAKGQYDTAYLDYLEDVVATCDRYNVYVLMDMHQDMFSRWTYTLYQDTTDGFWLEDPDEIAKGLAYGYNNRAGGDGAPRWVVQAALPEKDVGGVEWGLPLGVASSGRNTSNVLPWSSWFLNVGTSLDINRCFAALFAGDTVTPDYLIDGMNVKDYLQEAYANSFKEVARRVAKYPNVIGYDIINEPGAVYIAMTAWAFLVDRTKDQPAGEIADDDRIAALESALALLLDRWMPESEAELIREIYADYDILPETIEELNDAGFMYPDMLPEYRVDKDAVVDLNFAFTRNYLQPFFERVGQAILEEDPSAIIWVEPIIGLMDRGVAGWIALPMTPPAGIEQFVYAPHYYTDIYPMPGFNKPPREFTVDEIRFREDSYMEGIADDVDLGTFSLGDPPVVLAEFGTYYNFGGIEQSIADDYAVSSAILDPYYEVFEELLLSRMLWCYSPDNTYGDGEHWNKEDFSILDPNGELRSESAWMRPVPMFTSGRLEAMHFYSDHHYFEPVPDKPTPVREFYLRMGVRETPEPTEIFVPAVQYPDGFYAYISDGRLAFDPDVSVLYWYPEVAEPGAEHELTLRPPYDEVGDDSWDYFFQGGTVRENEGRQ